MSASLPDIVIDTQLEVRLEGNRTLYFNHIGDEAAGIRPERRADEWRRERKIGSGGFGTVWLERSISKREQCRAVKEISCRAKTGLPNKFYHELEAIGKFSQEAYRHCFVRSFGWYQVDSVLCIVMEYLDGGDLSTYISQAFQEAEAARIARQLLEGLNFMHRSGFAHRDLKPKNILVKLPGPQWWVKIGDFGISKRIQGNSNAPSAVGTEEYMAPEQLKLYPTDDKDLYDGPSTAVDIWALGLIVWELVTGSRTFKTRQDVSRYVCGKTALLPDMGSPLFYDFASKALKPSAALRLSYKEATDLAWIRLELPTESADQEMQHGFCQDIALNLQRVIPITNETKSLEVPSVRRDTISSGVVSEYRSWATEPQDSSEPLMNQPPHHLEATAISHRAEKVFDTSGKPDAALLDDSSPAITYNVDAEVADLFKTSEINISGFTHPSDCQLMNERRDMLIEKYGYMGASHRLKLAYDDCFAVMGADHFDTLQMSLSLAFVLRKQKKYQDAERLYRQANIRYRKRLGDRHAKLLQCAGLLGHVLCELGRYSEAVVYFRQVRDWFRQNSENDETRAACANCWVGRALLAQEEYEEAGAILQQAYEYFATAFGEDQRNAYSVAECLAASLCKQGRHYAANMLFQKAYNGYRRTDGETAESTLYAAHMLAQTAHARAIFRQAEQVSWEANQGCEDVIGERCSQNPQAINIHARALNKEVRHDEALELSENHQYLGRCFPSF